MPFAQDSRGTTTIFVDQKRCRPLYSANASEGQGGGTPRTDRDARRRRVCRSARARTGRRPAPPAPARRARPRRPRPPPRRRQHPQSSAGAAIRDSEDDDDDESDDDAGTFGLPISRRTEGDLPAPQPAESAARRPSLCRGISGRRRRRPRAVEKKRRVRKRNWGRGSMSGQQLGAMASAMRVVLPEQLPTPAQAVTREAPAQRADHVCTCLSGHPDRCSAPVHLCACCTGNFAACRATAHNCNCTTMISLLSSRTIPCRTVWEDAVTGTRSRRWRGASEILFPHRCRAHVHRCRCDNPSHKCLSASTSASAGRCSGSA